MDGFSASERGCARALCVWITALSLSAFGCARAHHEGARASEDGRQRDGTTRDPVRADDDEDEADHVDDDAPSTTPSADSGVNVPAAQTPGATPDEDERSTGELMADLYVEYQRDGSLRCPCRVADGVYTTLEDCLAASARQRPQVSDCLDRSVPPEALRALRSWVRCITDIKREHNACLERLSCDEETSCEIDTKRCLFPDSDGVTVVINRCPQAITIGP